MKGSIIIQDQGGGRAAAVQILGVPDLATMLSLADGLKDFTCGKIVSVSYTQTQVYDADDYAEGKHDSVISHKAILRFNDLDAAAGESPSMVLRWPAPVDAMVEQSRDGYIVPDLWGDSIAAVLAGRLGKEIEFRGGYIKK